MTSAVSRRSSDLYQTKKKIGRWVIASGILSLWFGWIALLLIGPDVGLFFDRTTNDNFGRSGAFGDSFGVIASFMTTVAAIGVYLTYTADVEARRLQAFEENFFTLLKNFESITAQTTIELLVEDEDTHFDATYDRLVSITGSRVVRAHHGRAGLGVILLVIRDKVGSSGYNNSKVVATAYDNTFNHFAGYLGHYFRSLYHLYRLIEERCPGEKMYYARIVRAQLSNPELCLIAYNCIVGEGRFKFQELAVRYSLFHNLHRSGLDNHGIAELDFFTRKLPPEAFRFEPQPPITFDD